jgi:hypothetical protein
MENLILFLIEAKCCKTIKTTEAGIFILKHENQGLFLIDSIMTKVLVITPIIMPIEPVFGCIVAEIKLPVFSNLPTRGKPSP